MRSSGSPQVFVHSARLLFVAIAILGFVGCEKADHFRIRGDASGLLTNDDLASLQRITGVASIGVGHVWGIYAMRAAKFDNQPVIHACVVTKFTHRDDAIAIAECVVCYKAAPSYLKTALHRNGAWGSFEKSAGRCVFVSAAGRALNYDDLPINPVIVRGDLQRADIIAILRSHPGIIGVLDPRIELGSSPDAVILNRTVLIHRRSDGTWW